MSPYDPMSSHLSLSSSVGFYGIMAQVSSFASYTVVFGNIFSSVAHLAVDHNFYISSHFLFFFITVLFLQGSLPIQLGRAEEQLIM